MALVGLVFGPLGTVLSELFLTPVRYSGSSLTYNLAGIFGASLAPYAATYLATTYGLHYVGYYLSAGALPSLIGLLRDARDQGRHALNQRVEAICPVPRHDGAVTGESDPERRKLASNGI